MIPSLLLIIILSLLTGMYHFLIRFVIYRHKELDYFAPDTRAHTLYENRNRIKCVLILIYVVIAAIGYLTFGIFGLLFGLLPYVLCTILFHTYKRIGIKHFILWYLKIDVDL